MKTTHHLLEEKSVLHHAETTFTCNTPNSFAELLDVQQLDEMKALIDSDFKLAQVRRQQTPEAQDFFKRDFFTGLAAKPFSITQKIYVATAEAQVKTILAKTIPEPLWEHDYYPLWIGDIVSIVREFAKFLQEDAVTLNLGSERGCARYHRDNVAYRLLVTYHGAGTEWLPDDAADIAAYESGEGNEHILKRRDRVQYLSVNDVAVFKGKPDGLLHKTPARAMVEPSLLLRLDSPQFWENIKMLHQG